MSEARRKIGVISAQGHLATVPSCRGLECCSSRYHQNLLHKNQPAGVPVFLPRRTSRSHSKICNKVSVSDFYLMPVDRLKMGNMECVPVP